VVREVLAKAMCVFILLQNIMEAYPGKTVLVVTHGEVNGVQPIAASVVI
jgi:hypothetical protein